MALANKAASVAGLGHRKTKLIVLCERIGFERKLRDISVRKILQRLTRNREAHPGGRQCCADRIADYHALAVRFCEFLYIMAAQPAAVSLRQCQHWQLHEVSITDRLIKKVKRRRIYHVFRIVEQDHPRIKTTPAFIAAHRLIKPVEAIGLCAGARLTMYHQTQTGITGSRAHCGFNGLGVVAITSNVDTNVVLGPCSQGMRKCVCNNFRFIPGWHENRDVSR